MAFLRKPNFAQKRELVRVRRVKDATLMKKRLALFTSELGNEYFIQRLGTAFVKKDAGKLADLRAEVKDIYRSLTSRKSQLVSKKEKLFIEVQQEEYRDIISRINNCIRTIKAYKGK